MNCLKACETFDDVATTFTRTYVTVRILLLAVHQRHSKLCSVP